MSGWIKLHRGLLEWEWYTEPKVAHLFNYLLLKASHNDYKYKGVELCAGQLPFGLEKAAAGTGLSVQVIRTSLRKLLLTNEITKKSTRQGTVITIVNWSKYQIPASELTTKSSVDQQLINSQLTTTNKVNNINNKNNIVGVTKTKAPGVKYIPKSKFPIEEIYAAYPRKGERAPGLQKLEKIIKTQEDFEIVMQGAIRFKQQMAQEKRETKYIKNFKTWVNNSGWEYAGESEDMASPKTEAEAFKWLQENYHKFQ